MKTKILFMAAASSMMLGLTSCSDFLEEENKVGETADLTYKTPSGLEGLVANCYTFARGWYGKEAGLGLSEMASTSFTMATTTSRRAFALTTLVLLPWRTT